MSYAQPYLAPQQPTFRAYLTGPLEMVTPPDDLALDLDEVKAHCRVEIDDDDDALEALIAAATDYVECDGSRTVVSTTFDLPVCGWWPGELAIPRPPLQSVTTVKYYDAAGTLATLTAGNYQVRTPWKQPGSIVWTPSYTLPSSQSGRQWPVVIRFVAGIADPESIPKLVKQAMLLLIEHWYDERAAIGEPLAAADRLLALAGWGSYR